MSDSYDSFARKLSVDTPAAFVLGGERGHGLAMTRSLGRRGIPTVVLGSAGTPGMQSRFGFPMPFDGLGEDELIDLLVRLGQKLPTRAVLLPTDDTRVLSMSRHAEMLGPWFRFALADRDTLEALADKRRQYEFAVRHGIPTPRTFVPTGIDDLARIADEIEYPCVIKPALSHMWREYRVRAGLGGVSKLSHARNRGELIDRCARMSQDGMGVIVQEQIEGPTDQLYAVYAYCPIRSDAMTLFVRRKIRDWPPGEGNGSYSAGTFDPGVAGLGRTFLSAIRYRGMANIEFKRDSRDGQLKLIEFNVRSASQLALPIDSGIDLPFIAYSDLVGKSITLPGPQRDGVRWIDFGQDALSFWEMHKSRDLSFGQWLRDLLSARSYAYFARDDLGPALARTGELIRGALRRGNKST